MKRPDFLIVAVLCVTAYVVGTAYVRVYTAMGGQADGARQDFGAAVSLACGRGFVDPAPYTPALTRFLASQSDSVSCSELAPARSAEPSFMQRLYRYLMSTAALAWRIRGRISWSALAPLHGVLYALTIAAAYTIFRAGMRSRLLAALASLALMVSSIHLSHLPLYRDYAKAPFILALVSMMAWMSRGGYTRRSLLVRAAAFGAILGVGLGFRNDLLISVPPFLLVVFCWAGGPLRQNLPAKIAAVALAAAVFVVVSFPVLQGYAKGSNSGHAAVSGLLSNTYDEPLAIRAPIYDWGYLFRDEFTYAILASYGYRVHGSPPVFGTRPYDRTATEYLTQIVRHTPADMLTRMYASTLKILEMPYTIGVYANRIPVHAEGSAFARAVYDWQTAFLSYPAGAGAVIAAAALLIVGASSIWAAVTLLALLVYYAGYPVLQFQHRHFFHLEFIGWLALGFVLERTLQGIWSLVTTWRGRQGRPIDWNSPLRALSFVLLAVLLVVGSLAGVRAYQQSHLDSMFDTYLSEHREGVAQVAWIRGAGKPSLLGSPAMWPTRSREAAATPVSAQYVVAEFSGRPCEAVRLPVTFKYAASQSLNDFSRQMVIGLGDSDEPTRVFFPAYYYDDASHFEGIQVPSGYEACVMSLLRVSAASTPPLLIDATFAPAWRNTQLFQTLAPFEPAGRTTDVYVTSPDDLVVTRRMLSRMTAEPAEQLSAHAAIVTQSGASSWVIRGRPDIPASSLLRFKARQVTRGSMLIAKGEARRGTFRIGLVDGTRWVRDVVVTAGGPFVAVLETPADGNFGLAIEADLVARWPAKYIGHRFGPWLEWLPGATLWTDLTIQAIGLSP